MAIESPDDKDPLRVKQYERIQNAFRRAGVPGYYFLSDPEQSGSDPLPPDDPTDGYAITTATWNVGPGSASDLREIAKTANVSLIALQEAGDRKEMLRDLVNRSTPGKTWRMISGPKADEPKTPVLYDAQVWELIEEIHHLVLPAQPWGEGNGPHYGANKYVQGGRFKHRDSGIEMIYAAVHLLPSQTWVPHRHALGVKMLTNINSYLSGRTVITMIAGDFNLPWDKVTVLPKNGWTSNHRVLHPIVTFAKHHDAIDQFWWKKDNSRITIQSHSVIKNGSDHHALIGNFKIKRGTD